MYKYMYMPHWQRNAVEQLWLPIISLHINVKLVITLEICLLFFVNLSLLILTLYNIIPSTSNSLQHHFLDHKLFFSIDLLLQQKKKGRLAYSSFMLRSTLIPKNICKAWIVWSTTVNNIWPFGLSNLSRPTLAHPSSSMSLKSVWRRMVSIMSWFLQQPALTVAGWKITFLVANFNQHFLFICAKSMRVYPFFSLNLQKWHAKLFQLFNFLCLFSVNFFIW